MLVENTINYIPIVDKFQPTTIWMQGADVFSIYSIFRPCLETAMSFYCSLLPGSLTYKYFEHSKSFLQINRKAKCYSLTMNPRWRCRLSYDSSVARGRSYKFKKSYHRQECFEVWFVCGWCMQEWSVDEKK